MRKLTKFAALAAGTSLLITPVAAQAGWGRRHHDRGIDAGDVIAGVLVLGAIAAIVGDNDRNDDRRRQERYPEPQPEYRQTPPAYQSSRGIDSAVSMCVDQVERGDVRVESVDNAARTADGWRVSGVLGSGAGWNCWIDNDGRIRSVDLAGASAGGQLSDEAYAAARAAQNNTAPSGPQPAYPGGPLPGEEGYDEAIQSLAAAT